VKKKVLYVSEGCLKKGMVSLDFEILHNCFLGESNDERILKDFLHKWLPVKVKYLAGQEAQLKHTKLRNSEYEEITGKLIELIFERIQFINPGKPFRSWICKAIILQTRNYIRKKKEMIIDTSEENNMVVIQLEKKHNSSPFSDIQQQKFEEAKQALPRNQYLTFVLKYQEGYSSQEIADMIGCSVSQVDQRNFKARQVLQKKLKAYFPNYTKN
jgi:RNA polymerase sigma factor (sigma-70 family)